VSVGSLTLKYTVARSPVTGFGATIGTVTGTSPGVLVDVGVFVGEAVSVGVDVKVWVDV